MEFSLVKWHNKPKTFFGTRLRWGIKAILTTSSRKQVTAEFVEKEPIINPCSRRSIVAARNALRSFGTIFLLSS